MEASQLYETLEKDFIFPELSDDWELMDKTNIIKDGVALQSKKLNTIVYDIPMRRYLRFCKMENLTVVGNKLQGEFAVGQDRSVYNKKDYVKWVDKYESRTENIISTKDAKIGHVYRTVCGLSVIYLGFKYTANIKDNIEDKKYTKISKVHYIHTKLDFEDENPSYGIMKKGSYKFIRDMGYALDSDEIANVFKHHYYNCKNIIYFSDTPKKNPEYGYIDVEPFHYTRKDWKTTKLISDPYIVLFSYVGGRYYNCNWGNTK